MKRFHVHVHVEDLQASIGFYTKLFGTGPTRVENDYAKWMLDDPRLNFAISNRGAALGVCAAEGVEAKRVGKEPNVRPLLRTVAEATAGKTAATWDFPPRVAADALVPRRRLGIDHLGFQTDSADELHELKARAEAAEMTLLDEGESTCCYARSEKHWITDPQGIAWEHFHTLDHIPVFSELQKDGSPQASACCPPTTPSGKSVSIPVKSSTSCCSS